MAECHPQRDDFDTWPGAATRHRRENDMANDDWMADVRRWYFDERSGNEGTPLQGVASDLGDAHDSIGYEAAWVGDLGASPGIDAAGHAQTDLR
jgi:hypothetical protein